ncbi:hypothetical protein EYF80_001161 [Liparis tanakae]|uniref:Uncharacterized protein n=1 Tax=Liparis tanakae TaxID=230148 RepID=A0A4Z2JDS6_9TELE|nr:hypothetical protein EYF80_001161 [Liparis tanakae]
MPISVDQQMTGQRQSLKLRADQGYVTAGPLATGMSRRVSKMKALQNYSRTWVDREYKTRLNPSARLVTVTGRERSSLANRERPEAGLRTTLGPQCSVTEQKLRLTDRRSEEQRAEEGGSGAIDCQLTSEVHYPDRPEPQHGHTTIGVNTSSITQTQRHEGTGPVTPQTRAPLTPKGPRPAPVTTNELSGRRKCHN